MGAERRALDRRNFTHYMPVIDNQTGKLLGHLSDISTGGFKLDCSKPLTPKTDYQLRIDLTEEVSDKPFMVFAARVMWCKVDHIDPSVYNAGFKIENMTPSDYGVFIQMFNSYGTQKNPHRKTNSDYIWG